MFYKNFKPFFYPYAVGAKDDSEELPGDDPNESTPSVVSGDSEETHENEAIAEQPSKLIPRSRMEKSLAKIAGDPDVADFKPKSRKERFLDNIAENGTPSGGGASMTSITYAELVALRNAGNLTPGAQYRIVDYVCTVANDAEARAVSHPYDIIVVADDKSTLNENARACLHEGDDYYSAEGAQADLSAWELKYCLDNDTRRFAWADSTNGKGVVFWLKDDWNNECPYDFKQIQFKRYKITACTKSPDLVNTYLAVLQVSNDITYDSTDFVWAYTFSGVLDESIVDTSVYNWAYYFMQNQLHCYDNVIKTLVAIGGAIGLNNIVFLASNLPCQSNTFGNDCQSNTFGNGCQSNTFGDACSFNTFGSTCQFNTFGNDAQGDEASAYCRWCTFEDGVKGVVLSNDTATDTNQIQNYHVLNGTQGVMKTGPVLDNPVQTPITINASLGLSYSTYVGKNSSGVVKTWAPADLVQS